MSIEKLNIINEGVCTCGKDHRFSSRVISGKGVLRQLPEAVRELGGKKLYVIADENTDAAAGKQVCRLLEEAGIPFVKFVFPGAKLKPDEAAVGAAMMHYDRSCDLVIAVGSGVLNDIGKLVAYYTDKPYIIVGTAPSMDGFASATSSMTRDGLKVSMNSRCADVILGDTDILCQAPMHMMKSGLGDMLAKYVSICEWRISNLINGEYYCQQIADLTKEALQRCVDNADGLLKREEKAVQAVFEGLVIGGVAMNFAGLSRPASGVEHYISHVLDMRAVEFDTPEELHGIQCAIGTLEALKLYEKLVRITPDREKALSYVAGFDYEKMAAQLREFLGKSAEGMILLEKTEQKFDPQRHGKRLEIILENWERILQIIHEELPSSAQLEALLDTIEAPKTLSDMGVDPALLPQIFYATMNIRNKYVLSHLCWDLGVIDEIV